MIPAHDRVIMISGANRGIGAAVARCLYEKGYQLSLGARNPENLTGVISHADPDRVLRHAYDANDAALAETWTEATKNQFGRIDGLVNNAGIFCDVTIESGDLDTLDETWAVNVKGPLILLRHTLPYLRNSGTGRVVNVASASGKRVADTNVGYTMTKFAVVALTHQVRHDAWDDGVRAMALCPGFVATDMATSITNRDVSTMTQLEDIAELVATAIALPNTSSVAEITVQSVYETSF
jgi:NADP-dependent 3-hydroxy acid dehydrogenase YdfG